MTRKQLIAAMKRERKKIAEARDRLRAAFEEYEATAEDSADGIESLNYAIEALSRNQ